MKRIMMSRRISTRRRILNREIIIMTTTGRETGSARIQAIQAAPGAGAMAAIPVVPIMAEEEETMEAVVMAQGVAMARRRTGDIIPAATAHREMADMVRRETVDTIPVDTIQMTADIRADKAAGAPMTVNARVVTGETRAEKEITTAIADRETPVMAINAVAGAIMILMATAVAGLPATKMMEWTQTGVDADRLVVETA
jgi:hypothetical protein